METKEVINIIKRYSADNDNLENVWKTCDDLIKLIKEFSPKN